MNKMIALVVGILFSLSILVVVLTMSEEILYETVAIEVIDEWTCVRDDGASEIIELSYAYDTLNYVTVNDVEIDLTPDVDIFYFWSDEDTIWLRSNLTNVGDEVVLSYSYWQYQYDADYSDATINVVELLPTLIILTIIAGFTIVTLKNKK